MHGQHWELMQHAMSKQEAGMSSWLNYMTAVSHNFFFQLVSGQWRMSLFLCVTTGCPPPRFQLHRSLQCCSLLNYYRRVWRDTCSLFSPLWQSLPLRLPHSQPHSSTQMLGLCLIQCGAKKKERRSLMCERQLMLPRKYSRFMGITQGHRHRSTYRHAWMHLWAGHTETQMLHCGSISRAPLATLSNFSFLFVLL